MVLLLLVGALAAGATARAHEAATCANRGLGGAGWTSVAGPHVRVHVQTSVAGGRVRAAALGTSAETAWARFARLLRTSPPSDAYVAPCRNGGDGRLDLYVVRRDRRLNATTVAAFIPYNDRPCAAGRPGIVVVRDVPRRAVLAHELFHAFQAAYPRDYLCGYYTWFDEATAAWAMSYVYPRDDDEHLHRGNVRLGRSLDILSYGGWEYIEMLSRQYGPAVVRRTLEARGRSSP